MAARLTPAAEAISLAVVRYVSLFQQTLLRPQQQGLPVTQRFYGLHGTFVPDIRIVHMYKTNVQITFAFQEPQ